MQMNFSLLFFLLILILSCSQYKKSNKRILSEFELINGIGPVKEKIVLNKIDEKAVTQGKVIFQTKCTSCHRLDNKLVGPPLRNVIKKRIPEFILNIIVNPVDMTLYHPEAKKLAIEYGSQMTFQNVNLNDAYKILDFLRYEYGVIK